MDIALYKDFLIACVGASASFIGLLFVALSVVLSRRDVENTSLAFSDRRLAESAFTVLVSIFFISLLGLIPDVNMGSIIFLIAIADVINSWRLARKNPDMHSRGNMIWVITATIGYLVQAVYGLLLIFQPGQHSFGFLVIIIIWLFTIGLNRAWKLTGIKNATS